MKVYTYDVFHRCESVNTWASDGCSLALDSTEKVEGKTSIKMTSDVNTISSMRYDRTRDWSELEDVVFSVYHLDWTDEIGWIALHTDASNYKMWIFNFAASWTEIIVDLSSTPDDSAGTLDLSNITYIDVYQMSSTDPSEDYHFDYFRGRSIDLSDYVQDVRLVGGIFPVKKSGTFMTHPDHEAYFRKGDTLAILDDSDETIFYGVITDKNRSTDGLYRYALESYYNEAHYLNYIKSFINNTSKEKLQDIIENSFDFITEGELADAPTPIDSDFDLNRQSAALIYLIRFLERQVIYVEPDGKMVSKNYNALTKIPQYFGASYNFRDDVIGTNPAGWTLTEAGNGYINVFSSILGHKKVLRIYDNDNAAAFKAKQIFTAGAQEDGTIEFWIVTTDNTQDFEITIRDGGDNRVVFITMHSATNQWSWYDGAYHDVLACSNNTLYHHKITFNCATDTFDWYINRNLEIAGAAFAANATSLTYITFDTWTAVLNFTLYIDALGYSWDPNYSVGDNEVAWDVSSHHQSVMLIDAKEFKTGYFKGSLGITRASVRMDGNVIRTKPADRTDTEQAIGVNPLKEYRDLKLVANAEADQLASNLFDIFSLETEFIALRIEGEGFLPPGETLQIRNTGSIPIATGNFCVISYVYDPKSDVYLEMIVSNNVVLPSEFTSKFDTTALQIHQANLQTFENKVAIDNVGVGYRRVEHEYTLTIDNNDHDLDLSAKITGGDTPIVAYFTLRTNDTVTGVFSTIKRYDSAWYYVYKTHGQANGWDNEAFTAEIPSNKISYKMNTGLTLVYLKFHGYLYN